MKLIASRRQKGFALTAKLFRIGLKQMTKDGMLLALLPSPFFMGILFKFGVPFVNELSEKQLSFSLVPWYGLVDGFLVCLTPLFTAMACAFLLLEERDEGIGAFYRITPAEGYPYLAARIGIPIVWAFAATVIALALCNISGLRFDAIMMSAIISTLAGLSMALMLVSLAGNRVEGLALSKLMGVSLLGLFLIWFVPRPYHFFGAFLPSLWIGKILMEGASMPAFMLGALASLLWIAFFVRRFLRRIE
jgi:fluoroquinolone transport system permease protein